jgi:two-component system, chemotaxis family, CheB/CheR fusion protein
MSGPPIVVVGASAGGLAAFQALLTALPTTTGLAFIFVQHLDPRRPTMLAEILPAFTAMSVELASVGTKPAPNRVYIGPQGPALRLERDGFHFDIGGTSGDGIDITMRSVAQAVGPQCIGILLSGGGTDGTQGLAAIRLAGGATYAQDPEEAEAASLPLSAIGNGAAEFVMPIAEIAQHLAAQASTGTQRDPSGEVEAFREILDTLRSRFSIDFRGYRRTTLERRIRRRATQQAGGDLRRYALQLKEASECTALRDDLLINVTRFFRDGRVFEAAERQVIPRLVAQHAAGRPVRVWVPACSTGEEVYTWAMILLEALGGDSLPNVQFFGTDVDEGAIQVARAGAYDGSVAHQVSPARLARFFTRTSTGYRVAAELRERCVFAAHNLLTDPPFSRMDLISCRNLLIYLSEPLQEQLMPIFSYALVPDGVLVLGATETMRSTGQFQGVDERHRIYRRNQAPAALPRRTIGQWQAAHAATAAPSPDLVLRACETTMIRRYAPPAVLVDANDNVLRFYGDTRPYLRNPTGAPTRNIASMAVPALRHALEEGIAQVRNGTRPHVVRGVRVRTDDDLRLVDLEIIPVHHVDRELSAIAVVFLEPLARQQLAPSTSAVHDVTDVLREELAALRLGMDAADAKHLEIIRSMEAAQDALAAANEELQSTNEELTSTSEELEASMEEVSTVNDELRNRNEALRATRVFTESLFERTLQPLLVLDKNLQIVTANPAFMQLANAPSTMTGRHVRELGAPWDAPQLHARLASARDAGKSFDGLEIHNNQNGRHATHSVHGVQTVSPDGSHGVLVGVVDITRYRLETFNEGLAGRAMGSVSEAEAFSGLIAHEVRTPLRVISGFVDVLAEKEPEMDAIGLQAVEQIRQATRRLNEIAAGLLEMSRVTRMGFHPRRVDLAVSFFEAAERLHRSEPSRRVRFECPEHLFLHADPRLVEMLVDAMMVEAWNSTRGNDAAFIQVSPCRTDGRHGISVTDNGRAEGGDDVFRPFSLGASGDGIGLALVARIAERHRGFAQAESLAGGGRVVRAVLTPGPELPEEPA